MSRPITVRDIARESGVHFTTAALALRDSSKVAAATRAHVKKVADKLGYRPNPLVSALMAQKRALKKPAFSSVLAYVTFDNPKATPAEASWFEIQYVNGARKRAHEMGYRLDHFNLYDPGMNAARLAQIFQTRAISGMLIGASRQSKSHLPTALHGFSSVALSYSIARPDLHRVSHDHCHGSALACHHLRRNGYRRIGLALTTLMDNQMDRLWAAGYLAFHEHLPASDRPKPLYLPENQFPHEMILKWLEKEKPDVILTMHVQIKQWLEKNRGHLGRPVEIATLDYSPTWGDCCGIWQKPDAMGKEAVSFLIGQIQSNQHGLPPEPITLMINGKWREGKSGKTRPTT